ncbi:hypothetical protein OG730_41665 (plasmid) [Streptomyces sp. NBC_01298]|uniref:hypothetical protein n=1 Tax=Streptomyces sp. NBC_01298 TaxID=2903817 RepID=UPI002E131429|nr:hypothetical protein OG730_41665 [Streptomyces sp. NBC_01298]
MSVSSTDALVGFLEAIAPAPTEEGARTANATHDALTAALTTRGVSHRTSGDSAGEFVHVPLPGGYLISLTNPLGDDYGYDWQVTDRNVLPVISGTLNTGPDAVAKRLAHLERLTG